MTIEEAAQLVIQSVALAKGKDIFILDMGNPVKILDLAKKMIFLKGFSPYLEKDTKNHLDLNSKYISIKITGLKTGEKLHEELMFENRPLKTKHPRIFYVNEKNMPSSAYNKLIKQLNLCYCKNDVKKLKLLLKNPYIQLNK